jgi:hypothetical protein
VYVHVHGAELLLYCVVTGKSHALMRVPATPAGRRGGCYRGAHTNDCAEKELAAAKKL